MSALLMSMFVISIGFGPVQFSGTASVYGEYGWVTGDTLVEPRPELRFTVTPTISLWGFPLSLDMLLSTQDNPLRQMLDRYRFFLHPSEWVEGMTNLSGFALAIKGIELGSCSPSLSPLILSGSTVLGASVELNPWYVYLAGAAGRVQRAVVVSDSTQGAYSRMLYSGKFGFGKKEGTHFYLTGMYVTDDPSSLLANQLPMPGDTIPPIDSFEVVTPEENYVIGVEFNLEPYKGAFNIASELAVSEVTRDKRLPIERWEGVPDWLESTFKPRLSSSVDYAFAVRPTLNVLDTRVTGEVEFVGPGYRSLGAPGLRNDNLAWRAGLQRDFLEGGISLSGRYSSARDNLLSVRDSAGYELRLKSRTTRFENWEASLGIAFPNLPYLQAGYYPYTQVDESLSLSGNVISASLGHSFQTGKVSHSPGISIIYSDVRGDDPSGDNTNWDGNLSYGLGLPFPLSLSAGGGFSRSTAAGQEPDQRVCVNVTPSYTLFEKWNNSLSLGGTFGSGTRIDMRLTSSFPVWKICDARLGVGDAIYSGDDGSYNDLRLTAELSRSW